MANSNRSAGALTAIVVVVGLGAAAAGQVASPAQSRERPSQTMRAKGTFDVKITPQGSADNEGTGLGRMSLEKQFQGDLEGTSKGEMLTAMTPVKESAGYVAIERVAGTLQGRTGSFILQHSGVMTRGTPHLVITVVPDSATGQLTGLAGTMTIKIEGGKHSYEMEYSLREDVRNP